MVKCEHYVRATVEHPADRMTDITVGVEYRPDDDVEEMSYEVKHLALAAGWRAGTTNHVAVVEAAKELIAEKYPDRAFFIETDEFGRGVQVYQPFGMPRELCAACGGRLCR